MIMPTCQFCGGKVTTQAKWVGGKWHSAISTCKKCKASTIKGFDFIQENKRGYLNG